MSYDELMQEIPVDLQEFFSFMTSILDSFEVIETSENGKTYKVVNENDIFSLEVIDGIK
jgi:hypothetical protein